MTNIFLKHTSRVRVAAKCNILVIALFVYFPTIGAETIDKPSIVESATTPPRNERAELVKSNLHGGEGGTKDLVNGPPISRPVDGMGVKTGQSGKDGGTKLDRGGAGSNESLNRKSAKYSDKSGQNDKDTSRDIEQKIHEILAYSFIGFLLVVIPMIPVFMQKPNLKSPLLATLCKTS